jgi:16S rRNA (cytosine1402-N4)-methyltransferase
MLRKSLAQQGYAPISIQNMPFGSNGLALPGGVRMRRRDESVQAASIQGVLAAPRLARPIFNRSAEMTAGSSGSDVDSGPVRHVPVLLRAVLEHLQVRAGGVYIDGTFGAGGYTQAILAAANCQVIGIDRDRTAIANGAGLVQASGGRLTLVEQRFSELDAVAQQFDHAAVDGVVLDVGVSSMQLDTAARGFSFRFDGPLDMRMGGDGPSAADVVANASERDLAAIIATLGEERFARPIARALVKARQSAPIATTQALVEIITRVVHPRPGLIHPATRTFQALRIFVNEELAELAAALEAAERILKPSGRLVVVAFHSLEDRIVKTFLSERGRTAGVSRHRPDFEGPMPTFRIITKKPVGADEAETADNPRARSAKLRAAERTEAPYRDDDDAFLLPRLPSLADVMKGR